MDLVGSLGIVLVVVSMFSGVVVGIVVIGCVVDVGIVVGIIARRVVRSCNKPARMLAFSASKSMRCGGGVMDSEDIVKGVAFVGAGGGFIGVVVGIVVVGIGVRRAVSQIRPARMLAFNASRSMRCGGTVLGREGGGVAWDFSEGWSGGGRLFGVASQSVRVCSLSVVA